ncbi:MAG TPA: hypothetical protein VMT88_07500 [Actinomycetes bacterium]|nr:hypothetical protein [Actinomycetes bacterium]
MRNRPTYQRLFVAAGIYNIVWGVGTIANPQWLWQFSEMPLSNDPQIFATLGMVIGLYGVIYFEVARRPEQGWVLAAVGLTGKVLGPIGLSYLIVTGKWPARTAVLCLTNDLMWWIPFWMYLREAWPSFMAGQAGPRPRDLTIQSLLGIVSRG